MTIVTLEVHFRQHRVFAHAISAAASRNDGGMLVTVYPGGSFLGLSFAALVELGTGRHEIAECDELDFQNLGEPPERVDESKASIEQFEAVLFAYQQGAVTSREVLGVAERVLKALNASQ